MLADSVTERRTAPRKLIDIDVFLSCKTHSGERQKVRVHDLSLTGMAIFPGSLPLNVGDALCICLSGSDNSCSMDHMIEATVVRCNHETVGIRFDTVGIHVLKDIQQLLRDSRFR